MFRLLTMAAWGETWPPTRMASCPRLIEMPPGLPDCRRLEPGHSIRPRPVSRLLERIDVGLVSGPDFHEVNYALESAEVVDVACVQRQADGKSGGCDQEIDRSLASRLSSRACDCGEDPSVSSRRFSVEREGFQGRVRRQLEGANDGLPARSASSRSLRTSAPSRRHS